MKVRDFVSLITRNLRKPITSSHCLKADLHMHSSFSDGVHTPSELVDIAKNAGLNIISITDHDTVGGVGQGIKAGQEKGLEVIPGIEISSVLGTFEIHILGYFIDISSPELLKFLEHLRKERIIRAKKIISRLNAHGFDISFEEVKNHAGDETIGRPHIADLLLAKGYIKYFHEAFDKYLARNKPAFVEKAEVKPDDAVKIIHTAGGLAVLAHPGSLPDNIINRIVRKKIDGIETLHPSHSPARIKQLKQIRDKFSLLDTGGSDYHGNNRGMVLLPGDYSVSGLKVDKLKNYLSEKG